MIITRRLHQEYKSSFLRSVVRSLKDTYSNEKPDEQSVRSVLQFAAAIEIIPTIGILGNLETFTN